MSTNLDLVLRITGDQQSAKKAAQETVGDLRAIEAQAKKTGDATKAAANSSTEAYKLSGQQLSNMQFQMQDMAVSLASGQSPFTVMAQQGSQIVGIFKKGTSVMSALKAAGSGLMTFLTNPLNLAVVASGLVMSGLFKLFDYLGSAAPDANKTLELHAAFIKNLGDSYDASTGKAKNYFDHVALFRETDAQNAVTRDRKALEASLRGLSSGGELGMTRPLLGDSTTLNITSRELRSMPLLEQEVSQFLNSVRNGQGDVKSFAITIEDLAKHSKEGSGQRELLNRIIEAIKPTVELADSLKQSQDALKGVKGDTDALSQALGKAGNTMKSLSGQNAMAQFRSGERLFDASAPSPNRFADYSLLDLIGKTEGTDKGRGYNETLGYGKFTGNLELVTKSLGEILAIQRDMLANPQNTQHSSALGRYQLTSQTIKDFMPRLGLNEDTTFSPAIQDLIANAVAQSTGGNAKKLRGRWTSFDARIDDKTLTNVYDNSQAGFVTAAEKERATSSSVGKTADAEKKKALDQEQRWAKLVKDSTDAELAKAQALGKSTGEQAKLMKAEQLWAAARSTFGERLEKDKKLNAEVTKTIEAQAAAYGLLAEQTEYAKKKKESLAKTDEQNIKQLDDIRQVGGEITRTFLHSIDTTHSWGEALASVAEYGKNKLLDMLDSLFEKLAFGEQGTGNGGALGGIGAFISNFFSGLFSGPSLYAQGGAFAGGAQAFATGGQFTNSIVSQPTHFKFGGKLGLMGEAGPEAILPLRAGSRVAALTPKGETSLPLTRMSDGSLGVAMPHAFAKGDVFGSGQTSAGGFGQGDVKINSTVHNYEGAKVTQTGKRNSDGSIDLQTMIGQAVNKHIAGGGADPALNGRYSGLSLKVDRRG
jgi:muramidase (phage lysozyme)